MSIESMQAKRVVLVAQRDQLVGQINMSNGAIAIIDELIAEELAEQAVKKSVDAELSRIAAIEPPEVLEAIGVTSAPEMLPVLPEDDERFEGEELSWPVQACEPVPQ